MDEKLRQELVTFADSVARENMLFGTPIIDIRKLEKAEQFILSWHTAQLHSLQEENARLKEYSKGQQDLINKETQQRVNLEAELERMKKIGVEEIEKVFEKVNTDNYCSKCGFPARYRHYARGIIALYNPKKGE